MLDFALGIILVNEHDSTKDGNQIRGEGRHTERFVFMMSVVGV